MNRKRTYKPGCDQLALDRIAAGTLYVNPQTAEAFTLDDSGEWRPLVTFSGGRNCRYRFVRLYWRGARKAFALHRLVWLAANLIPVPAGCEIHHRYGTERNDIDALECVSLYRHRQLHPPRNPERGERLANFDKVIYSECF